MIDERAEALALMQRSLGFMMNRKLAAGISSWREYVYGKSGDDPMAKALRHMMNRELSRGWLVLFGLWEEAKAKRESMRRSLESSKPRAIGKGWRAWITMVEER